MTPRTMAIAWILHRDLMRFGGNRSSTRIALDLAARYPATAEWKPTSRQVAQIAHDMGWGAYLTDALRTKNSAPAHHLRVDAELETLGGARSARAVINRNLKYSDEGLVA